MKIKIDIKSEALISMKNKNKNLLKFVKTLYLL